MVDAKDACRDSLLPGKTAREFRRQSAAKVCRLLGGDSTLTSEIEQRRAALESTAEGRATQSFLLGGSSEGEGVRTTEIETYEGMPTGFRYLDAADRQAVAKQVVKHELQRQEQALKRQRCDDMFVVRYKGLVNLEVELDDRMKSNSGATYPYQARPRHRGRLSIDGNGNDRGARPQHAHTHPWRWTKGTRDRDRGGSCETEGTCPPQHVRADWQAHEDSVQAEVQASRRVGRLPQAPGPVSGTPDLRKLLQNCYYARDEDIVEKAIKTKLKISV